RSICSGSASWKTPRTRRSCGSTASARSSSPACAWARTSGRTRCAWASSATRPSRICSRSQRPETRSRASWPGSPPRSRCALSRAAPEEFALSHPGATFSDRLRRDFGASVSLDFRRPVLDATAGLGVQSHEALLAGAETRRRGAEADRRRAALDLLGRWRVASLRLGLARGSLGRAEEHLLRLRNLYAGGAATL